MTMVQKKSEEKKVGTAEIIETVAELKGELNKKDKLGKEKPELINVDRVLMLFTKIYNYDLDQLIKADKKYKKSQIEAGKKEKDIVSFLDELDNYAKKCKELNEVLDKRFKDTETSLEELDPADYARARVELLKKLRPEIEKESERIQYEMQKANKKLEGNTPAVDYSIPIAGKGVETEQMKRKETEKAKKEREKREAEEKAERKKFWREICKDIEKNAVKYVAVSGASAYWGWRAFPYVKESIVNLAGEKHLGLPLQKIQNINWRSAVELRKSAVELWRPAVELAKMMNQTAARVGPSALKTLGTATVAIWTYVTTFTAIAGTVSFWSIVGSVAATAVVFDAAFRPQDIQGVIDRTGDKMVKRQEYNLKIVDVARYETMCEVNQGKIFALVEDINLEQYIAKYEKLGVKISEGKEIAKKLKGVPEEAKLYLASKLYEIEENVKAAKREDFASLPEKEREARVEEFVSSPAYLKFVLRNLKQ